MGAGGVGLKLPGPGDGRPHQNGGNRHDDGHDEQADNTPSVTAPAPETTEDGRELGDHRQHRNGSGERCHDGQDQRIPVAHVGHFMGQHSA